MLFSKLTASLSLRILLCLLGASIPATAQETFHISSITPIGGPEHATLITAYSTLGIQVVFHELPGRRSLRASNDGIFDGEAARMAGIEKKYQNLIPIMVPIRTVRQYAYATTPIENLRVWEDMEGLKVGFRRGILINEKQAQGLNVVPVSNFEELFARLERGAIHIAILEEKNSTSYTAGKLYRSPVPIETTLLYHYIHKSRAYLVDGLTKALQALEKAEK